MNTRDLPQFTQPANIASLRWPDELRLFVLCPHPDDFDEVGITLRYFHQNGNVIHVAVASGSASGVLDDFCVPPDAATKAAVREHEQLDSLRFFGLAEDRVTFLRLTEDDAGDPMQSTENEHAIRRQLLLRQPDMVFLPHGSDSNTGHQHVYSMFRQAARELRRPVAALLFRDPKTLAFCTDLYLPFDEKLARWKRELLLHHGSQQHRNLKLRGRGFDDRILDVNRQVAQELACTAPYAEAFQLEEINGS